MRFDGVILSSIVGVWAVRLRGAARGRGTVAVRSALRSAAEGDAQHGFGRSEMGSEDLPGTCAPHDKHIFVLVSDEPSAWPPKWEESAGLPQALAGALKARKAELGAKLKLTAATALPAAGDASSGDVLVYPDGIRVRGVRAADADALVDLLAGVRSSGAAGLQVEPAHARSAEQPPASGAAAVFVCAHTSRDKRCGVIGPALGEVFAHELAASGRRDVAVRLCSHIGGHKYAGSTRSPHPRSRAAGWPAPAPPSRPAPRPAFVQMRSCTARTAALRPATGTAMSTRPPPPRSCARTSSAAGRSSPQGSGAGSSASPRRSRRPSAAPARRPMSSGDLVPRLATYRAWQHPHLTDAYSSNV